MTGQDAVSSSNPYIGPRPFNTAEKDRFFGREREALALLPLVINERLVLFYAQSGAGKSSLVNVRLIPMLEDRNFFVLPTGRVSGQEDEAEQAENPYVYNLLRSLQHNCGPATTLPEYLANLIIPKAAPRDTGIALSAVVAPEDEVPANTTIASPVLVDVPYAYFGAPPIIEGVRPVALIIDQFEEIFITHQEKWQKRDEFFEQLCQAQKADPYLWVVLVMREDYVARIDPYAHLLYGGLRAHFYMNLMDRESALEAVTKPVCASRPFEKDVAELLVDTLRRIPSSETTTGTPQYGQFVEPFQLQVVCYQLWEQLKDQPGASITMADLKRLAKSGDLAQFISGVLADLYDQAVGDVVRKLKNSSYEVTERELRNWFSTQMITEVETRNLVFQEAKATGRLNNAAVRLLAEHFLILAENRGEHTWYELSHDRFVKPILQSNRKWLIKNANPVETAALTWLDSGKDAAKLYDGRQLKEALNQVSKHPNEMTDQAKLFIQASQVNGEQRAKRRQRALFAFFALLVVVLSGLTIFSLWQERRASQESAIAVTNAAAAEMQKKIAESAMGVAVQQQRTAQAAAILEAQQRSRAETASALEYGLRRTAEVANTSQVAARVTAEAASAQAAVERDKAEAASTLAVIERDKAEAARLASLSEYFRKDQISLSLLLAIQSVKVSSNGQWQSQKTLFEGVQSQLSNRVDKPLLYKEVERPIVNCVAFSPDGSLLAVGSKGLVEVWDLANPSRKIRQQPGFDQKAPIDSTYPVNSVAFDDTGTRLAFGNAQGKVYIWDLTSDKMDTISPFPVDYAAHSILAVAFQPHGDYLALATSIHPETQKGMIFLYNYKQKQLEEDWKPDCGEHACQTLAWSPDGSRLAVGGEGGSLQVFDFPQKLLRMKQELAHADRITGLVWFPDDRRLVTSGEDMRLALWDTDTQAVLKETKAADGLHYKSLAISPDGRYLISALSDQNDPNKVYVLFDAPTLQINNNIHLAPIPERVVTAAFSPQGDQIVAAYGSTSSSYVNIWRFEPTDPIGVKIPLLFAAGPRFEGLALGQDGKLIFAQNSASSQVKIYTQGSKDPLAAWSFWYQRLILARINGRQAVVLGRDNREIFVNDAVTGASIPKLITAKGRVRSLAVNADGTEVAAAYCDSETSCSQVARWHRADGQPLPVKADLSRLDLRVIRSLAYSPDGKTLALGSSTGKIVLIGLEDGKVTQAVTEGLSTQNIPVSSLAYSALQDNLLAAGFDDGQIGLWEVPSCSPIGVYLERAVGEVTGLLFRSSPQSDRAELVSLTAGGDVRAWPVDMQTWIDLACVLAKRPLTPEEKAKFLPEGGSQEDICPHPK